MTTNQRRAEERQALTRLLEVYGADRTRWPARERLQFAGLIAEDKDAQRQMCEAAALDELLDRASSASKDREHALKERIMAAALRSVETKLAVVDGDGTARSPQISRMRPAMARGRMASRHEWPAAAMLAASLFVGVLLGSAGTVDTTVQEVAEATGLATADATGHSSQLAFGDDLVAFAEEDLL
jgi:hypothetical protein